MSYTQCTSCGAKALSVATQCPRCGVPFESRLASYPAARPRKNGAPVVIVALVALGAVLFGVNALIKPHPALSDGFAPPPSEPEASTAQAPPPAPTLPAAKATVPTGTTATAATKSSAEPSPASKPNASTTPAPQLAVRPTPPAKPAPSPATAPARSEKAAASAVPKPESPPEKVAATTPAPTVHLATAEPEPRAGSVGVVPKAPPLPSLKHAVYSQTERRYTKNWVNVRKARRPGAPVVTVLRPGEPVQVDSLSQEWYRVVAEGQAVGYVYRGFVDPEPPGERN